MTIALAVTFEMDAARRLLRLPLPMPPPQISVGAQRLKIHPVPSRRPLLARYIVQPGHQKLLHPVCATVVGFFFSFAGFFSLLYFFSWQERAPRGLSGLRRTSPNPPCAMYYGDINAYHTTLGRHRSPAAVVAI